MKTNKSKCKTIFIAGTDTNVGKTVITAFLAKQMKELGLNVAIQKWVSTGCSETSEDIEYILKVSGLKFSVNEREMITPYNFAFPSSPHLSAFLENKKISPSIIKKYFLELQSRYDYLLVEGVGGLCVPLNQKLLLIDLIKELRMGVLLVARAGLGTINHTMLSLAAMSDRNIKTLGIVFNETENNNPKIVQDNMKIIKKFSGANIIGLLPKFRTTKNGYRDFKKIGSKIVRLFA